MDLVNRGEFIRRLDQILRSAKERGSVHAASFFELTPPTPDLETAGGEGCEPFLQRAAATVRSAFRSRDTLGLLEAGRFGVILSHCPLDKAIEVSEGILQTLRTLRYRAEGTEIPVSASVGVVPFTAEAKSVDDLLARGREACGAAQALGGGQVQIFRSDASDLARRRHEVMRAAELLDSLENGRFELYAQPILPLMPGSSLPAHYEILLRLRGLEGQLIPPSSFILAAERYELMEALDRWVIRTVLHRYHEIFDVLPVGISINLSGRSVGDDAMLAFVKRQIEESPIPSKRICFEITETAAINDLERAKRFMTELKKSGCRFALDDFGSGHSSFTYLKHLPVDYLKIDGSFVRDILNEPFDRAMVEAIRQMGHGVGIRVIAEWAENDEILERLRELGIDYAQGWAVGRPQPIESFAVPARA